MLTVCLLILKHIQFFFIIILQVLFFIILCIIYNRLLRILESTKSRSTLEYELVVCII